MIAAASILAKRYPSVDAPIASLPLVSALGMISLRSEKPDAETMTAHAGATCPRVRRTRSVRVGTA